MAAATARRDHEVLLIDADTYGGVVAQSLGMAEQPSLLGAVRAAVQRGVVHQHVDLSKAVQNPGDHALHLRRDCHIGLHR